LNFSDNESKLILETVKAERNLQKTVEVFPLEPTAEEIAAKEAAAAAALAAAKGKKGVVDAPVEEKPVERKFRAQRPDFLDSLFND
jgi:hypothetical protein